MEVLYQLSYVGGPCSGGSRIRTCVGDWTTAGTRPLPFSRSDIPPNVDSRNDDCSDDADSNLELVYAACNPRGPVTHKR